MYVNVIYSGNTTIGPYGETTQISKEEEFLKEYKTLLRTFINIVKDTTLSANIHKQAKECLAALEEIDAPIPENQDYIF